jgi:hypothetical protein
MMCDFSTAAAGLVGSSDRAPEGNSASASVATTVRLGSMNFMIILRSF